VIRAAIRYPYIVLVGGLIVLVLGLVSYLDLPADLLSTFKTPAVQIVTFYPGMPPEVIERDITSRLERWTGQSVGIEHQEARSMLGVSIVKDFFREGIAFETAMSQVTSYAVSDMFYLPSVTKHESPSLAFRFSNSTLRRSSSQPRSATSPQSCSSPSVYSSPTAPRYLRQNLKSSSSPTISGESRSRASPFPLRTPSKKLSAR